MNNVFKYIFKISIINQSGVLAVVGRNEDISKSELIFVALRCKKYQLQIAQK